MSKLHFDGGAHQLKLIDDNGDVVGTWTAYNNVDRRATITHVPNRRYLIQDRVAPRIHTRNANGPYGLHGIIRFQVSGHPGIGVHSGRASALNLPGPAHPTMGCIRTTDEAMQVIADTMRKSALTTIEVENNHAGTARAATRRHGRR